MHTSITTCMSHYYPRHVSVLDMLYTTPVESSLLSTGVVYSRVWERGYQMLCLCSCSSWGWACQGPKYVEDSSVTYMLLLNCALKLVEDIILYYDARSKKNIKLLSCFIVPDLGWTICGLLAEVANMFCNLKKVNKCNYKINSKNHNYHHKNNMNKKSLLFCDSSAIRFQFISLWRK